MVRDVFFNCLESSGINATYYLVEDYFVRLNLQKLGGEFNLSELEDFEVKYLSLIGSEVSKLEQQQAKRKVKK